MALADLIDAKFQTLSQRVTVGGVVVSNVLSVTHDKSWDQNTASCVITVGSRQAFSPNNTTEVKVYEGYGGFTVCTFTGYIDDWKAGSFPNTWELHCRDKLKRAEQVWLKDTPVTYNSTQAETAVTDLLSKAGLAVTAGTTSFTIGDVKPAEFKLVSIMDAVNQIASLIGWKLWQDVSGTIYFQYRKPRPSSTSVWNYTYGSNVIKRNYLTTDKDLRNRVVVLGYWNPTATAPIRAETYASSPYTNVDIIATLSSELIDTQSMADTIAAWMLVDLNTLCHVYEFDCVGNPLMRVGDTIHITDSTEGVDNNFFVFTIRSEFKEDSFIYHVTAVRWDNDSVVNYEPPTPPGPVLPPPGTPGGCTERSCTPGKGNLFYLRHRLKGIAKCEGAYGTDGTDGVASWSDICHGTGVAGSGTISSSSYTITGVGTHFLTEVAVGDRIRNAAGSTVGLVTAITNDTQLTLDVSTSSGSDAYTIEPLLAGLTIDALKIRFFTLDPFSLDGDHFTQMYAMAEDGFYRCDGLPDSPVWAKKLSKATAASLVGCAEADLIFQGHFAPSYYTDGWIGVLAGYFVYNGWGNPWYRYWLLESTDRGETWSQDANFWIDLAGDATGIRLKLHPSPHISDTLYVEDMGADWYGDIFGPNQDNPRFSLYKRASGTWSRAAAVNNNSYHASFVYFPWCDSLGSPYSDDDRLYSTATAWESGVKQLTRSSSAFTPPWSVGYTPPTWENIGDANMTITYIPALGLAGMAMLIDMWNESNQWAWVDNFTSFTGTGYPLWKSSDLAGSWSQLARPTVGSRNIWSVSTLFLIPVDPDIILVAARANSGGGWFNVFLTPNGGSTWYDVTGHGQSDGFEEMMGLTVNGGASDELQMFVDYFKV